MRSRTLTVLTWEEFEESEPDMARFGAQRISERVMYIRTIRKYTIHSPVKVWNRTDGEFSMAGEGGPDERFEDVLSGRFRAPLQAVGQVRLLRILRGRVPREPLRRREASAQALERPTFGSKS
jgi:hypothetical protein